tara:strand:+ start:5486 stop:5611 length:126 start_codon:yes stop_codon:yes gene_type:complete
MERKNTKLIRVRKDIIKELLKNKKKGESYSDILDKYVKVGI